MIQQIKSRRLELPTIFLVETKEDWEQLPKGLPYIVGTKKELEFITIFLEFQVLLRSCNKLNIPIDWEKCLERIGYSSKKIRKFDLFSGGSFWDVDNTESSVPITLDDFIESEYLIDFDRLANLKILPKWLDDIKEAIHTNIIDEVAFDPTAFNKQLGINIGTGVIKHNLKNLLILDVSGSIPNAVVKTITGLAKVMSKRFYADVIVTGGKTLFFDYEQVLDTNFVEIAQYCGRNNEGKMFAEIVKQPREYNTVISFGDNDHPKAFESKGFELSTNFKVETLYSLHTGTRTNEVTGYARVFKPKTTHIVKDWVITLIK